MIELVQFLSFLSVSLSIILVYYYYHVSTKKLKQNSLDLYHRYRILSDIDSLYIKPDQRDDIAIDETDNNQIRYSTNPSETEDGFRREYQENIETLLALYSGYRDTYEKTWKRLITAASSALILFSLLLWTISLNINGIQRQLAISANIILALVLMLFSLYYSYRASDSMNKWEEYNRRLDSQLALSNPENIEVEKNIIRYQTEKLSQQRGKSVGTFILLLALVSSAVGYIIAGPLGGLIVGLLVISIVYITYRRNGEV